MGRPRKKIRPLVVLTEASTIRVGSECRDISAIVERAAAAAVTTHEARELAFAAERLAKIAELVE